MRAIGRILVLSSISALLISCGGGGNGKSQQVQLPDPPAASVVSVGADIKQLIFSWDVVATATHYRLLENPDGHSGFTQVGGNIPGSETSVVRDIAVHLHDWAGALYLVQACNSGGCTDSTQVSATDAMLETIGYLKSSSPAPGDKFGQAIALSSDGLTMAIAAPEEHSAVYVFQRNGEGWDEESFINPPDAALLRYFGGSIDLSADGRTLAIDSSRIVYIYGRVESGWEEQGRFDRPYLGGGEVALSEDGATLAVGAPEDPLPGDQCDAGSVYVFQFDGADWTEQAYLRGSNTEGVWCEPSYKRPTGDLFGQTLALNAAGDVLIVAAPGEQSRGLGIDGDQYDDEFDSYRGAAYVFRLVDGNWSQEVYIKPSSHSRVFGEAVVSNAAGNILAITTQYDDATEVGRVYIFKYDGQAWVEHSFLTVSNAMPDMAFQPKAALNAQGDLLVVGSRWEDGAATGVNGDPFARSELGYNSGAVYVFANANGAWSEIAYIKSPHHDEGDFFGAAVAFSADGDTLVVGAVGEDGGVDGELLDDSAPDSGAVYVY